MKALGYAALSLSIVALIALPVRPARAAERGEGIQVTNVGVPLVTTNFGTGKTTSIADKMLVTEFLGAHYFISDRVRIGMMAQFTEQFAGGTAAGSDRWSTFALLPQVGWHFYERFFVAGVFTYAPRSGGKDRLDLGVQGVVGGSIPITDCASFGYAVEVPYNFRVSKTLGVTPLIGLSYRL
ncbi:MAG: autotransporter domain-containing protein [Polyangiaceae bacterium]